MEVGVRELRNHLSRYLDRVRDGNELIVTDRGHAIARVVPVGSERTLDRLIAEGIVTPAREKRSRAPKPIKTKSTVSGLVGEQRR
jgi:prevent-host-death family protein